MALLRQQQQRLAVVKAVKVFFGNQNFLRTILKQQVSFTLKARVPHSLSLQHVKVARTSQPAKIAFQKLFSFFYWLSFAVKVVSTSGFFSIFCSFLYR